jgi:hypothetical protein
VLVSIIVPCHIRSAHDATLLGETLDTVAAQSQPYELIVVDDGSFVSLDSIVSGRQSITDAGLQAFDRAPDAGFVVGPRQEMNYDGSPVAWTVAPPPPQAHVYATLLGFEWYIIPPSSAMFRRRVVEKVGGFRDPWGADDLDFYLRVAYDFTACCYQSPAVTRYRRYSASSSRDGERMLRSIRVVYERQRAIASRDPATEAAFHRGLQLLTEIFLDCVVENVRDRVRSGERGRAQHSARLLAAESPQRWQTLMSDPAVASALQIVE